MSDTDIAPRIGQTKRATTMRNGTGVPERRIRNRLPHEGDAARLGPAGAAGIAGIGGIVG